MSLLSIWKLQYSNSLSLLKINSDTWQYLVSWNPVTKQDKKSVIMNLASLHWLQLHTDLFAFGGEHVRVQQGLQAGWCEQMLDSCKWLQKTACAPPTHISIQANSKQCLKGKMYPLLFNCINKGLQYFLRQRRTLRLCKQQEYPLSQCSNDYISLNAVFSAAWTLILKESFGRDSSWVNV